jgi:hypothetical protein
MVVHIPNIIHIADDGLGGFLQVTDLNGHIFVGSWSETGTVFVHDISEQTALVDDAAAAVNYDPKQARPNHAVRQHNTEGFAIDWSQCAKGTVALL